MIRETGVLIRDILKMKPLENCKIIAGEEGLNRVVTKVNIMAAPDVLNWVKQGEFLLTTTYFIKELSADEQIKMIEQCNSKDLSGIGIKFDKTMDALPKKVEKLADKLKFPILKIDYDIPLTDIMTPVFQEIFDRQSNALRKVEYLHKDMMNTVLKGGSIKEIITYLEKSVKNPIVIKDHHFDEIYVDKKSENNEMFTFMEDDINRLFKSSSQSKLSKTMIDSVKCPLKNDTKYDDAHVDRIVVPIIIKNNVYANIAVYGFNNELSNFDSLYLETTSNVIAMEILKKISVQEVENKYRAEFFEDLISLDEKRKMKALERSNQYKLNVTGLYNILSIRLTEDDMNDEELSRAITKIIYTVESICKTGSSPYLIANKGYRVSILLMWNSEAECRKEIRYLTDRMKNSIEIKLQTKKIKMGIGRVYTGLENTHKSLTDSEKAIDASELFSDAQIVDFNKLGVYKIFCQDNIRDELINYYHELLHDLAVYDRKKESGLIRTLKVYFETNGNLKKMSEILFAHYNTVLYRINRIQEITGKDLENEQDRYGIQTALTIMKILNL